MERMCRSVCEASVTALCAASSQLFSDCASTSMTLTILAIIGLVLLLCFKDYAARRFHGFLKCAFICYSAFSLIRAGSESCAMLHVTEQMNAVISTSAHDMNCITPK